MYIINYKCLSMLYTTGVEHSLPQEIFFQIRPWHPRVILCWFQNKEHQQIHTTTILYYDRNCVIKIETMYCAVHFFNTTWAKTWHKLCIASLMCHLTVILNSPHDVSHAINYCDVITSVQQCWQSMWYIP